MNYLTEPEQIQRQERLKEALKMAQLLKLRSLTDWSELVSRYSEETGERIQVRFEVDENRSVTGMYYVWTDREIEIDPDEPSPLDQAIVHLTHESKEGKDGRGFNLDDLEWGRDLAQKIERGETLSPEIAQAALERIRKYTRQLAKADIQLPRWEAIAYHYDPNAKPMAVVEGNTLDSPLDHPKHLRPAFEKEPEPLESSALLMQSGDLLGKISHHFRSSNGGLDGFDLLQAGTGLVGAGLVVLGRLNEHFRRQTANNQFTESDQSFTREIGGVANALDNCKDQARQILSARGKELPDVPESKLNLSLDPSPKFADRQGLVQWINFLDTHQRSLLTSLDEERQPKPINLSQSDAQSIEEAIKSLKDRQKDFNQLISQVYQQEKPISIIGGAISPENLHQRVEGFFRAREAANDRMFNPGQRYSHTEGNITLTWHKSAMEVQNNGHPIFHLTKKEGGFKTSGFLDIQLSTRLSLLPQTPVEFEKLTLQGKLQQGLQKLRQYRQRSGEYKITKDKEPFITFKFSPSEREGCLIRGFNKDGAEIWRSGQQIEVNNLYLPVLKKLSDTLARPTKTATPSRETRRETTKHPTLTL